MDPGVRFHPFCADFTAASLLPCSYLGRYQDTVAHPTVSTPCNDQQTTAHIIRSATLFTLRHLVANRVTMQESQVTESAVGFRPEILEVVLGHLKDEEAIIQVTRVCKQWHDLIHGSEVIWARRLDKALLRLHRGLRRAPATSACQPQPLSTMPGHTGSPSMGRTCGSSLLRLYLACQARNFLRNPTFSKAVNFAANPMGLLGQGRRPWMVKASGQAAAFENPPQGVCYPLTAGLHCYPPPPLPDPPGEGLGRLVHGVMKPECPGCLATPQDWVEVVQIVDFHEELQARGLTSAEAAAVLGAGLPLGLSLMVASHHQHAATFAVGLLLDDGHGPVPSMQSFVPKPSSHHFFSGKKYLSPGSGWVRFAYVLPAAPPGFNRVVLLLRGRQATFDPALNPGVKTSGGPYGVKFASASLHFLASQDVPAFKENAHSPRWRKSSNQASSEDMAAE